MKTHLSLCASCLAAALIASAPANAQTVSWSEIGPGKLNYDDAKPAHQPAIAVVPGTPNKLYAIWAEDKGSLIYHIRVAVYHSDLVPNWTFVDRKVNGVARPGNSGINRQTSVSGSLPRLHVLEGNLFAAWTEGGQVRVAAYNGNDADSNWTFVDGNSSTRGLNYSASTPARDPDLVAFNGKLYAAWHEQGSKVKGAMVWQIRVKAFDPGTLAWSFVDGGGPNGINFNNSRNAQSVWMAVLPGATAKLYISWHETDGSRTLARAKVYSGSGSSWSGADGGGLNYSTTGHGSFPYLFASNSKMYVFWEESAQIRVRSYDGSNDAAPVWNFVDGGGPIGINVDPTKWAYYITAAEVNGKMFVGFNEYSPDNLEELRIKSYNGDDSAPVWTSEDGGGAYGLGAGSQRPQLTNLDSRLHIIDDMGNWPDFGIHAFVRTESP